MDFVRVEVERRRMTPKRWIPRLFMFFAGFVLLLISLILMITIIGILPGLGLGSLSVLLIFGAFFGGERFECPRCGFKNNFPACGLKNALPSEVYSAMARYFDADYKYYGILLRAKASVDPTILLEEHSQPFVEAWHAAILKRKQQKIRRFDDYLYASFRQAAWTVKARENRVKNVGLLAEFETFLQAE